MQPLCTWREVKVLVREIWTALMLLAGSVMDIKDKTVPAIYLLIAAVGSVVMTVIYKGELKEMLLGLIPGAALLITGKLSGCMGEADGILLLLLGGMYGLRDGGELMMYALLTAAAASFFLIVLKHAQKKDTLPFIPFMLAGFMLFELRVYFFGGG